MNWESVNELNFIFQAVKIIQKHLNGSLEQLEQIKLAIDRTQKIEGTTSDHQYYYKEYNQKGDVIQISFCKAESHFQAVKFFKEKMPQKQINENLVHHVLTRTEDQEFFSLEI